MRSAPAVPATFEDLTPAWLDDVLRAGRSTDGMEPVDADVAAVDVEPLGPSAGLLGDLARLRITYGRGHGPATLIVKLPASDPGGRQVGTMLRAWAREVAFYREVAPASPGARVPACYWADGDPDRSRWVVVLEDCRSDPADPDRGATARQAEAAVDALAVFHATWWQSATTFDWMPGFDTTGVGGLLGPWLEAIPVFLDRYAHVVPAPTGEWLRRFAPTLGRWSDRVATEPLTVVHADYRLENLLFDGDEVTMIDWQTALRGPGAMDLTSFVVTGLAVDARRASERELIDRYLDGLGARGVAVDREWFGRSYDENLLWWMGQFANNLARLEPDDPATQRALDTMIERTYQAALDRDVGRLLG